MPRATDISIYEQREGHTLLVKTRAPVTELGKVTADVYPKIFAYLAEQRMAPSGAPFITYHNMDMNDLEISVGVPVPKELPARGSIVPGKLPNVKVVTCVFRGPYHATETTYKEMHEFIAKNKLTILGVVRESYLNSPANFPEEELLTRISMPIK